MIMPFLCCYAHVNCSTIQRAFIRLSQMSNLQNCDSDNRAACKRFLYRRPQLSGSRIWDRGIWARLFGALQVWPPAHVQDSPNTQCKAGAVRMPLQCSQTAADALQATRLPLVRSSAEAVDLRSSRPHTRHAFQRRASIGTRVDGNSIGARKRSQPESISAT